MLVFFPFSLYAFKFIVDANARNSCFFLSHNIHPFWIIPISQPGDREREKKM